MVEMGMEGLPAFPGTGEMRGRISTPTGRGFGVRGTTLYERVRDQETVGWQSRGQLNTATGAVELRENDAKTRLFVRDVLQTYAYVYETQAFTVIQTAPRIRVRWQYAPALGPAVAFRVYRQVGSAAFARVAEVSPVTAGPDTYTYLDTAIQPGGSYSYYVVAVTASGEESAATATMTVEMPRSVQAPQSATAVFVAGS